MNTLALFLVAVNPAAIAATVPRAAMARTTTRVAFMATAVTVAVLAGGRDRLLDWLDVSAPTFQVAAGVVLGLAAVRWILMGARPIAAGEDVPVFTLLISPQLVAVAITAGVEVGAGPAFAATVVALLVSGIAVWWQGRVGAAVWSWAARLVGVAGVAVALALVVDGVKTV